MDADAAHYFPDELVTYFRSHAAGLGRRDPRVLADAYAAARRSRGPRNFRQGGLAASEAEFRESRSRGRRLARATPRTTVGRDVHFPAPLLHRKRTYQTSPWVALKLSVHRPAMHEECARRSSWDGADHRSSAFTAASRGRPVARLAAYCEQRLRCSVAAPILSARPAAVGVTHADLVVTVAHTFIASVEGYPCCARRSSSHLPRLVATMTSGDERDLSTASSASRELSRRLGSVSPPSCWCTCPGSSDVVRCWPRPRYVIRLFEYAAQSPVRRMRTPVGSLGTPPRSASLRQDLARWARPAVTTNDSPVADLEVLRDNARMSATST